MTYPVSILHKSIAGRYRPVRVADGPITARCRFMKNASWVEGVKFYDSIFYTAEYYFYAEINIKKKKKKKNSENNSF